MAKKDFGRKLMPEYLLKYSEELHKNHPDPSAEWGGDDYTAGYGIDISDNEISVDEEVVALKSELDGYIKNNDSSYEAIFRGQYATVKADGAYTSTTYADGSIGRTLPYGIPGYTYTLPDKTGTFAMTSDIVTSYNDLTDKPTIPTKTSDLTNDSGFITGVTWNDVSGKPTFATVATSGDYDDLTNKPTIPAAQIQSDWNQADSTKLDYIKNKPSIPSTTNLVTTDTAQTITGLKTLGPTSGTTTEVGYNSLTFKLTNQAINDSNLDLKVGAAFADSYLHPSLYASKGIIANLSKISLGDNGNSVYGIKMPDPSSWGADRTLATTADIPTVPTKTSDLTNDSGFITSSALSGYATETWVGQQGFLTSVSWTDVSNKPTFATVATSGSYTDLTDKPTIPTVDYPVTDVQVDGVSVVNNKVASITMPTIPTVNDPTITFTQGGVTKGTISLNQASNQTIALDAGGGSTPAYEITNMVVDSTNQTITLTITQNN